MNDKQKTTVEEPDESYEDWLCRTSIEAEANAEKNGWLTTEQVEAELTKRRHEFYKKHQKAA